MAVTAGSRRFAAETHFGPVGWRGIDVPARWQVIGKYGTEILSSYPSNPPEIQRRNGVGDISPLWMVPPGQTVLDAQRTRTPANVPGIQRNARSPQVQLSAYQVTRMRQAVTQAQVKQSGAGVIPFVNALLNKGQGSG